MDAKDFYRKLNTNDEIKDFGGYGDYTPEQMIWFAEEYAKQKAKPVEDRIDSFIMKEKELAYARNIGTKVALEEIKIPCPACLENEPQLKDDPQLLSSIGDREEILFCPHCKLEITMNLTTY